MPSTNPPRTYLGSASPVGEQRFTFRFTKAPCLWQSPPRIDRLVHPSREQCFRLQYAGILQRTPPLPSRQCPSRSQRSWSAPVQRGGGGFATNDGCTDWAIKRGVRRVVSYLVRRRPLPCCQRSGHRCHDRRHHDRRFFYPSSVRTSSLQDFVRGRAHVIHFRLGVDIRVRYF